MSEHNKEGKMEEKIDQPNIENGIFQNLSPTSVMLEEVSYFKLITDSFKKPKDVKPNFVLPSIKTDLKKLKKFNSIKPVVIWFGHSSYLIYCNGITILVDPVFCGYASPFPFMITAFNGANIYGVEDMPEIDYLILTHNHYDHFDVKSIKLLQSKIKNYCVPLGLKKKVLSLVNTNKPIFELDWMDSISPTAVIKLTSVPARHFSGRGLKRNETLWTAYVLELFNFKIFLGGDSGYDVHFKEIGKRFQHFDLAILECGQYGINWPLIHTTPEQTVEAAIDLNASVLLPVHWAKFALANHPWDEPIKRAIISAAAHNLPITTPKIGEPVIISEQYPQSEWWNF